VRATQIFNKQLRDDIDLLDKKINSAITEATEKNFKEMVRWSPVWSGHYVSSQRIGINRIDKTKTPGIDGYMGWKRQKMRRKATAGEALEMKNTVVEEQTGKLREIDKLKKIVISNSVLYADKVEFGDPETNTRPRAIFRKGAVLLESLLASGLKLIR